MTRPSGRYHQPVTPEERERLRATIQGLLNAALQKYPNADPGTLKQLWNEEVDRRFRKKPPSPKPAPKAPQKSDSARSQFTAKVNRSKSGSNDYRLLPPLSREIYEALRADIKAHDIRVPIEIDAETGAILDGHHRAKIAEELGIEAPTVAVALASEPEKRAYVIRVNLNRRQLTPDQRKEIANQQRAIAAELRASGMTQAQAAAGLVSGSHNVFSYRLSWAHSALAR